MKRFPFYLPLLLLGCLGAITAHAQTVIPNNTTYTSTVPPISGPSTIDTSSNTVTVASGANVTYQATTSIRLGPGFTSASGSTFHAMLVGDPLAPVITSASSAGGAVGSAFRYNILATHSPTSFGATGLPGNLILNSSTGSISGLPSSAGTFNVTLSAFNSHGSGTRALTLTILTGGDSDADGVSNAIEQVLGTNPNSGATTDSSNQTNLKVHRPTP